MEKIKVLIVDDQNLMRDGLKTILEQQSDIDIIGTAVDGCEACDIAFKCEPDVVLLDIRMPNMNGVECTKLIKEKSPNIKVLILTTFDDEEYIADALNYGASGYLLKDIYGDKLVQSIRDAYNGNLILPPELALKLANSALKNRNDEKKEETSLIKIKFSDREREIAEMLSEGFTNKQIASALYISEGTIKNYVSSIYNKLGINDRTAAAIYLKEHSI